MEKTLTKVLLIEDNPADVILLREALEADALVAFEVAVADRLKAGINLLYSRDFDVILLDLGLPDSQGLDTFIQLHKEFPDAPTIILSGLMDEELALQAIQSGAQDYLVKRQEAWETAARAIRYAIERQRSQIALRESEIRFRNLFEHSPIAYQSLDERGHLIDFNEKLCELLGYEADDLIDAYFGDLWSPETRSSFARKFTRFKRDGEMKAELQLVKKDGALIDVLYEGRIQYDSNGQFLKTHCILHEITQSKLAENAMRESQERFSRIFRASPVGISITDVIEGTIIDVNDAFLNIFGYTRAEVLRRTTSGLNLWQNPQDRDQLVEMLGKYGKVSNLDVKISRKSGEIGDALVSAELIELNGKQYMLNILNDITERTRAGEALQNSEKRFRALIENGRDNISLLAADGTLLWESPSTLSALGYAPNQFVGHNIFELMHPDDQGWAQERFAQLIQTPGKSQTGNFRLRHQDDSWHWMEGIASNLLDEPDIHAIVINYYDITERKQVEQTLAKSEALYRQAIEVAGAVPYYESYYDNYKQIKYDFIGEGIREITGYGPEEFTGTLWDTLILDVHPVKELSGYSLEDAIQRVRSGATSIWQCEFRIRHRDGEIRWVFEAAIELRDEHGTAYGSIGTYQDITERKQAEAALRQSEERFRSLFEHMLDGVYLSTHAGRFIDVNPALVKMFGYSNKEEILKVDIKNELYFVPEERGSHVLDTGNEEIDIYRMRRKDGSEIWVEDHGSYVHDEQGNIIYHQGILRDITERKQTQEKLGKSEIRFASIFHTNPTRVSITSFADSRFLDVNESFLESSGYSRQEVIGHTSDSLNDWVDPQERIRLRTLLEEQGSAQNFETKLRQKSGNILDILISAELIELFDQRCILSVGLDITNRKQNEQKLLESNERFEQLANNIEEVFWITDAISGKEIYISPAAEKVWGQSAESLMHSPNTFIDCILPEDRPMVLRAMAEQKNGRRTLIEYRVTQPDGSVHWVWDRAFPIFDDSGKLKLSAGIAADITERKQAEKDMAYHLTELEALYENGLAVGRLLNQNEIGERIIATFARYLSWHHVAIRLRHPESDKLELVAFNQPGLSDEERTEIERRFNSMISKVGQGISGWVVQTGKPLRTGDVNMHSQYVDTHANIQSGLYMPLKIGDRIIGVISVESDASDAFTEEDERLLATLANQAAIAFENARLYQSSQQELLERKRVEIELRTSETHYRELADSITDIFFELDQNLHYSHWNKASEVLTGIPEPEAIGKSIREIFGESEEQARIEKIYQGVLINQQSRTFETLIRVNNQQGYFEVNAYPSLRGVAVVAKDITERKRSEIIMQKRFKLMEFAARHSLEEIMQMMTDEVSNLTGSAFGFFNIMEADQSTPGLQIWPADTLGRFNVPVSEGQHRSVEQAGVWAEALRQRRAIIHNDYESLPNKKSLPTGHAPIIREMVIPIIRNEKILAVMGIANKPEEYTQQDLELAERFADYAWDITERKQMELALADERNQLSIRVEERTADFRQANANLARALRVKDEFMANMSHELRTPLNAILGLSESLAEQTAGPLNEKQQRYITTVSESGHHLLSLINDILDLAKIEAGQITLDINKVDINSVSQASLRMIKQLAQKKKQEVVVAIDGRVSLMWADERRLKQMLVNLLGNAVKFTPEGGKLGLEVHGDQDQNKVTFTIWDTGIGIKEVDLPRLFQPFVQLDAGLAREASGTGLGLALVAQMARLHGGSVSVTSQQGQGSRFSIMLPWEPALAIDTLERLKTTGKFRPVKFNQGHKPTILLIEDTQEVIMMLSDYLELNGFKVITAYDGVEGVTQAQLTHPDLILMDIQMPRMDGFEATKKLRSEPEFEHTPIIALTALAMSNDRERCLAAGMDEYITKPVHLRSLVKIIENFLSGEKEIKPQ